MHKPRHEQAVQSLTTALPLNPPSTHEMTMSYIWELLMCTRNKH